MLRKLYDGVFNLARHRHATPALAVVSFAESSFFPIPPDVMLAPMILAKPKRLISTPPSARSRRCWAGFWATPSAFI